MPKEDIKAIVFDWLNADPWEVLDFYIKRAMPETKHSTELMDHVRICCEELVKEHNLIHLRPTITAEQYYKWEKD